MNSKDELELAPVDIQDMPKDVAKEVTDNVNTAPTFEEMSIAFDKQIALVNKLIDSLSKNSLCRVFKKVLAYPLKHDEIVLFKKDEAIPYEIAADIQQLKINMMLEQLRLTHEEEANKMKESVKNEQSKLKEESNNG